MADDRAALLAEANRRGLLTPDMKAAYEEATKRGMVGAETTEPPPKEQGLFSEMTEQAGVGVFRAATGLAGLPGDVRESAAKAGKETLGIPEGVTRTLMFPLAPTSGQIQKGLEPVTGKPPEPTGLPGEWARTFGEFLPSSFFGGGGIISRIGRALFPSLTSEAAGQTARQIKPELEPAARFAGALTPTALQMMVRSSPDRAMKAIQDLFDNATKNYQHADVKALSIKPASAQSAAMTIADELAAAGADLGQSAGGTPTASGTANALTRMMFQPSKSALFGGSGKTPVPKTSVTIDDIQAVRQQLRDVAGNFNNPVDQKWAVEALGKIDDWLSKLSPQDLLAGDIKKAMPRLEDARGDWWAAKSLEALSDKLYAADLRAGSAHSGTNLGNIVRQNVRSILLNKKLASRYTDEERQMLERIVEGTAPENMMRWISKLLPRHGVMGALLHGTMVGTLGPAGIAGAAVGEVAGSLEQVLANKLVRDVQRSIVERSPSGQAGYKLAKPPRRDVSTQVGVSALSAFGRREGSADLVNQQENPK